MAAFVVTSGSTGGAATAARAGLLLGKMATPNFLLYARNGTPAHLTRDSLALPSLSRVGGFQLVTPDLYGAPGAAVLRKYGHGLHRWLNLDGYVLYAAVRDQLAPPDALGPANDASLTVSMHGGKQRVTADTWMDFQAAARPDIIAALSDEVPHTATASRVKKAMARSLAWLDRCIALHGHPSADIYALHAVPESLKAPVLSAKQARRQREAQAAAAAAATEEGKTESGDAAAPAAAAPASSSSSSSSSSGVRRPLLFAVLQGGALPDLRAHFAGEVAKRAAGLDGFIVGGLGSGESAAEQLAALEATLPHLPAEKPRVLSGQGAPEEVLTAMERGVDLFEAAWPYVLAEQGVAVALLPLLRGQGGESKEGKEQPSHFNLRDRSFVRDSSPLVPGCECHACGNHSRAYVHHLLNTHEMLAHVLLQIHNVHQYAAWFAAARQSIEKGQFPAFAAAFRAAYAPPTVEPFVPLDYKLKPQGKKQQQPQQKEKDAEASASMDTAE